jgi:hypothetical protein
MCIDRLEVGSSGAALQDEVIVRLRREAIGAAVWRSASPWSVRTSMDGVVALELDPGERDLIPAGPLYHRPARPRQ